MPILHQHLMKRVFDALAANEPVEIILCDVFAQDSGESVPVLTLCDVQGVDSSGSNTAPTLDLQDIKAEFEPVAANDPPEYDYTGSDASPWARGAAKTFVVTTDDPDADDIGNFTVATNLQTLPTTIVFERWNGSTWEADTHVVVSPTIYRSTTTGYTRKRCTLTYNVGATEPTGATSIFSEAYDDMSNRSEDFYDITITV